MEQNERPDVTAVCGMIKMGKTAEVKSLLKPLSRVLILDSLCKDYSDGAVCYDMDILRRVWLRSYRGPFHLVGRLAYPDEIFPELCDWVMSCGDLTFIVEEAQLYFHAGVCCREFTRIITHGSHFGVRLIAVTQSPRKFGDILRSQANEWIVFRTREEEHVDYLRKRLPGISADRIRMVPAFTYLHYNDAWDSYYVCHRDLRTGRVERQEIPYGQQQQEVASDRDAGDLAPLGLQSEDRPEGPQVPQADGHSSGG
jgi:hypothetical protein